MSTAWLEGGNEEKTKAKTILKKKVSKRGLDGWLTDGKNLNEFNQLGQFHG